MKKYVDVIVVIPLAEEFEVVIDYFEIGDNISTADNIMFFATLPGCSIKILLVQQNGMGKTSCAEAVELSLKEYDCGILACVGIAGGLSFDFTIGDVCYAGTIVDVTENTKVSQGKAGSQKLSLSSKFYRSPSALTIPITVSRIDPTTKAQYAAWRNELFAAGRKLIPNQFQGPKGLESLTAPTAREGIIACGLVSASPEYNEAVRGVERKVAAIETESGALFAIADRHGIPALTVRGISDYAGVDKTQFERDTDNNARKFAAMTAASFLATQLSSKSIGRYLDARASGAAKLPLELPTADNAAASVLIRQDGEINERLRELAPAYPLVNRGYRLPVPRVRLRDSRSAVPGTKQGMPREIRDALRDARVITLDIPREYPDLSLSWIIAKDLLTAEIEGKHLVPVVVEARSLQRPRIGLAQLTDPGILSLDKADGYTHVFIVNDFDFGSTSRTNFLKEEVNRWPDAKFIIITRNDEDVYLQTSFAQNVAASIATLCDVSFSEMAAFMRSAFDMHHSASEVVAARLRDIFKRYALAAHPSYFAGIPPSTLNTLLQANRRAELIEIAVMGYLSFIVADDRTDVVLSRRTRERFLSEVVRRMNVERAEFSEAELTAFAEEFAQRYDYDISPARFVAAFIAKRILHIEEGKVRFTLPFMESYLLAKHLSEVEDAAVQYFSLEIDKFDYRTFALYAEMGAASVIVEKIDRELAEAIATLRPTPDTKPFLFDTTATLAFLNNQQRLASVEKRLQQAEDDVRNDRDQTKEKQKLLDVSDQITEDLASRSQRRAVNGSGVRHRIPNVPLRAEKVWAVSVNLLGSGAERLEASRKRGLIEKIVELTGLVMDRWIHAQSSLNFVEIKNELLAKHEFVLGLASSDSDADRREAERLLGSLVDFMEFLYMLQPFWATITYLCEEARDVVLAESVAKAVVDGPFNELVRNLWLADIDVSRGRGALSAAIKRLPRTKMLRHAIATHLMVRVFWRHWRKEDRLALLDIADQTLRAVGASRKTGELKRIIEKLDDESDEEA